MDEWKRKKQRKAAKEAADKRAAELTALAAIPKDPTSSEDEADPPSFRLEGIQVTLTPGFDVTLVQSPTSPQVETIESTEARFRRLNNTDGPLDWESSLPGRRPDTLVVRGLPLAWFDLTLSTLNRQHVISASSRIRRLLEKFGTIRDMDVRTPTKASASEILPLVLRMTTDLSRSRSDVVDVIGQEPAVANDTLPPTAEEATRSSASGGIESARAQVCPERNAESVDNDDDGGGDASQSTTQDTGPDKMGNLKADLSHLATEEAAAVEDTAGMTAESTALNGAVGSQAADSEPLRTSGMPCLMTAALSPLGAPPRCNEGGASGVAEEAATRQNVLATSCESPVDSAAAAAAAAAADNGTFEALVQYRTYDGFLASLRGLGGHALLRRDFCGLTARADLGVCCDFGGHFAAAGLQLRAAAGKAAIRAGARRRREFDREGLRVEEGARAAAQAGRVATCGLELRLEDLGERALLAADDQRLQAALAAATQGVVAVRAAVAGLDGQDPLASPLRDEARLAAATARCRAALRESAQRLDAASREVRRAQDSQRLRLPTVAEALARRRCGLFAGLLADGFGALGLGSSPTGLTLLAVDDLALLGDRGNWDNACWGLHLLEVPLTVNDLLEAAGGTVQPLDRAPRHGLRFRMNMEGKPTVWVIGDSNPPRKAVVVEGNVKCDGGVVVHFLDRVLYTP